MHGSGFWGMGPWMWLVWLLILGGIVWAVYAITRQSDGTGHQPHSSMFRSAGRRITKSAPSPGPSSTETSPE